MLRFYDQIINFEIYCSQFFFLFVRLLRIFSYVFIYSDDIIHITVYYRLRSSLMSTDSEHRQPSFRFRDRLSRLKDRVKDKVKDKAIKHNITLFVHQNFTSNNTHEDYSHTTRYGFRQHMHHYKDVLKNKTHYESIKDKIKDKIDDKFDLHHNKTYPKGFYDSLFSPESENDVYLQTALICLWVIAVLCIIPTIIIIFLPARKKNGKTTSTNMIFFHVFFCELCYLSYVLLAMINVAKDFRLGSTLCDYANYGL